jgi:hypothetical protein
VLVVELVQRDTDVLSQFALVFQQPVEPADSIVLSRNHRTGLVKHESYVSFGVVYHVFYLEVGDWNSPAGERS